MLLCQVPRKSGFLSCFGCTVDGKNDPCKGLGGIDASAYSDDRTRSQRYDTVCIAANPEFDKDGCSMGSGNHHHSLGFPGFIGDLLVYLAGPDLKCDFILRQFMLMRFDQIQKLCVD